MFYLPFVSSQSIRQVMLTVAVGGIPGARSLMKALANPFLKNFVLLKID